MLPPLHPLFCPLREQASSLVGEELSARCGEGGQGVGEGGHEGAHGGGGDLPSGSAELGVGEVGEAVHPEAEPTALRGTSVVRFDEV